MRLTHSLLLSFSVRAIAQPVVNGMRARADDPKATWAVVNVDGSNGDGDCDDCDSATVTVTKAPKPTTVTYRVTDTVVRVSSVPVISIVPVEGKPDKSPCLCLTLHRPPPSPPPPPRPPPPSHLGARARAAFFGTGPSPVSSSIEVSSALPSANASQPSVPVWSAPSAVPSESVSSAESTSWAPTPTTLVTLISSITEAPVPESTTHTPDDGLWYSAKYPPHHNGTEGRFWK
ncbi:predicted protein [Verticillium alfalfae VaMs.102]|uniref:Predicted protein n=1 Tax=Verticillium alfalfae (strain VaMs.102 / ATCC MYA-4576 / FGSC 10136) TaxID=526221 RepID=C9SMV4_VERA1|nr:predicted protein [Verticillium alfalfae VaMs.102]EEY20119.1 predicted protein [Verticillium alfalfae VaMs.102]